MLLPCCCCESRKLNKRTYQPWWGRASGVLIQFEVSKADGNSFKTAEVYSATKAERAI